MAELIKLAEQLLPGLVATAQITALGAVLAAVIALVFGLGRLSRRPAIRALSAAYVQTLRGASALVLLFWMYYALPLFGLSLSPMQVAVVALGLHIGAYGAEIVRGAIQAVPAGQYEAARALSMSWSTMMRRVILPQAVVAMLPPFGNLMIELLKATALVSLITISDLTFKAQLLRTATARTGEIYALVLVMYFAVALVITFGVRGLERRLGGWQRREATGSA